MLRIAALVLLIGCGPRAVTSAQPMTWCTELSKTCNRGRVLVETALPVGTELSRGECDEVCASVLCPAEEKRCWVVEEPLDGRGVMCVNPNEPGQGGCPFGAF